jgi:hypothetical protein
MPRSPTRTCKQTLARIQRLCCLGIGSEMLMPDLMREVMWLVPSQHGQFCWAGSNAEIAFIHTFSDHKLWPMSTPVLQLSQTLRSDKRTFRLSDFYNLLWRQADMDEPILMIARDADRNYGVLSVYRAPGEAGFSHRLRASWCTR